MSTDAPATPTTDVYAPQGDAQSNIGPDGKPLPIGPDGNPIGPDGQPITPPLPSKFEILAKPYEEFYYENYLDKYYNDDIFKKDMMTQYLILVQYQGILGHLTTANLH